MNDLRASLLSVWSFAPIEPGRRLHLRGEIFLQPHGSPFLVSAALTRVLGPYPIAMRTPSLFGVWSGTSPPIVFMSCASRALFSRGAC